MPTVAYWLHALSPTHAGTGRGVGYIDLPIDRDAVTGWPLIRASAFKGVWADHYQATEDRRKEDEKLRAAFGLTDSGAGAANSGSLIPTDAHLVCLPVRSFRGTFAWATSPLCLRMLRRTLELAGWQRLPQAPPELRPNEAHHPPQTQLKEASSIYLEDLDFCARECDTSGHWAKTIAAWVFPSDDEWQQVFTKRFVVLPDLAFDFLTETGTEVHTRVRIDDETRTVAQGALWTEESLPAETILAGIIQCDRIFAANGEEITPDGLMDEFTRESLILQIGGKATVGRGQMRCVFSHPGDGGAAA